jgi:8-oxo-dGTP pyrophosphatase MutT (NUDIX family)
MKEICSGILFITKENKGLFLERSGHGDYEGLYGLPGGHLAPKENHKDAAVRETKEETGYESKEVLIEVNRQLSTIEGDDQKVSREIDYTTFVAVLDEEFTPILNKEHKSYIWAPLDQPPEPLHPGLVVTLKKLFADELQLARMMVAGELPSPQKYMNLTLFDMRITGTGLSYRSGLDEFVWRDSSLYLNEEFLARCNGLPVIFEHPKGSTLNTKEYVDRNIGSVFIPYIKGEDVWAVVKVWDSFAADIMENNQLSTSPAVVLYGDDQKSIFSGKTLLIEGKPKLLDHLAICYVGVWDKAGPPVGVSSLKAQELAMADEDNKAAALEAAKKNDADKAKADAEKAAADADKAKTDADAGELLDKTLKCLDSISTRMDAFEAEEKKREDARAARRADKQARKDAKAKARFDTKTKTDAEIEEEKKKADAKAKADAEAAEKAKADADTAEMRKRISDVEAKLPKQMTDADYAAQADAQMKADRICLMHGRRASRALEGESLMAYRRRLANDLKEFSTPWKSVDLNVISDDTAFGNVEAVIYADAEKAGLHPPAPADDFLREIINEDITGRKISTFVGRPSAWMRDFSDNRRYVSGFRNE